MTRQPDFRTGPRAASGTGWASALLAAGVLAAGVASYQALRAREEARTAGARLAEVTREVAALKTRHAALEARAEAGGQALLALDAPPSRIVADVATLLPPDVRLERLAIDYQRGGTLEMLVVARDAAAWDLLLERLERAPRIRDVEPGPEARAAEVRSLVRARWSAAP
ncbi:MAG TPA: hypothetical protein VII62_09130 [Vicinamibacteria bacterium]